MGGAREGAIVLPGSAEQAPRSVPHPAFVCPVLDEKKHSGCTWGVGDSLPLDRDRHRPGLFMYKLLSSCAEKKPV